MDWESRVIRCKLLHIEWINNKGLRDSMGGHIQYPVVSHNGKEYKKERVCVCNSNFAVQQSKFTNTTL